MPARSRGFYIFAIVNAALYALLVLVIIVQHARENVVRISRRGYRPAMAAGLLGLLLLPGIATAERGREGLESLAWGAGRFSLFEEKYSVAGAGVGGPSLRKITFKPRWLPHEPNFNR